MNSETIRKVWVWGPPQSAPLTRLQQLGRRAASRLKRIDPG